MKHTPEIQKDWINDLSVKRRIKFVEYRRALIFHFDTSKFTESLEKVKSALQEMKDAGKTIILNSEAEILLNKI